MSQIKRRLARSGNRNADIRELLLTEGFEEDAENRSMSLYYDKFFVNVSEGHVFIAVRDNEGDEIARKDFFFDNHDYTQFVDAYEKMLRWGEDYA